MLIQRHYKHFGDPRSEFAMHPTFLLHADSYFHTNSYSYPYSHTNFSPCSDSYTTAKSYANSTGTTTAKKRCVPCCTYDDGHTHSCHTHCHHSKPNGHR